LDDPRLSGATDNRRTGRNSFMSHATRQRHRLAAFVNRLMEFGTMENPRPKWLHVLAPSGFEESKAENDVEKEIAALHRTVRMQQAEMEKRFEELPAAIERQLRFASGGGGGSNSSPHLQIETRRKSLQLTGPGSLMEKR